MHLSATPAPAHAAVRRALLNRAATRRSGLGFARRAHSPPAPPRRGAIFAPALMLLVLALAGCASAPPDVAPQPATPVRPSAAPLPANAEPPPPAVNLSGFPLPYRQGYADGCASATGPERKDAVRFGADGNYRTGWTDGLALCRKK
jgi:hypothetical protein